MQKNPIPFAEIRFPDPDRSRPELEARFTNHFRAMRAERADFDKPMNADGTVNEELWQELLWNVHIPRSALRRIDRRSACIAAREEERSGLGHLKSEDRKRLETLREGVGVVPVPSEHRADELAAELHDRFPWMGAATELVWQALRRSIRIGDAGFRLPPLLLVGPPGIGKSTWARHLATLIGVPEVAIDAASENASFAVAGSQRGWGSAGTGRPLDLILQTRIGNPIIIVDEIEKAGRVNSISGGTYDLQSALLAFLEPATSRRWNCPYLRIVFDMSWLGWVLTSNSVANLSSPLLSRCRVLRLPPIDLAQLLAFAEREAAQRGLSPISIEAIVQTLRRLHDRGRTIDLRTVSKRLDLAEMLEARPMLN
ncbi:AAA family ATPase [Marinovum sp. SP66]|uniref:AAA family ATPase n=1 Tax=Marinovum sp. SP66 TaxID=3028379 RepID=UPI00237A422C|nr:AAA family ATPase [Marinovum sp. SP66]MDD9739186.1 AAA family ATPase [Marinovum sp. SP66]